MGFKMSSKAQPLCPPLAKIYSPAKLSTKLSNISTKLSNTNAANHEALHKSQSLPKAGIYQTNHLITCGLRVEVQQTCAQ